MSPDLATMAGAVRIVLGREHPVAVACVKAAESQAAADAASAKVAFLRLHPEAQKAVQTIVADLDQPE